MKKLIFLSIATLTLTLLVFISCNSNDDVKKNENPLSKKTELQKSSLDYSRFENPFSLEGEFKIWKNASNELIIFTETSEMKHIFLLQETKEDFEVNGEYSKITFLDHGIVLESNDNAPLFIGIENKPESIMIRDAFKQNRTDLEESYGDGLVHMWFENNSEIAKTKIKYELLVGETSVLRALDDSSATCDSGGEGATSCSINSGSSGSSTGCSVSCGAGYYSCCTKGGFFTATSCKCVKK